mmetsp:Transcript_22305/g.56404  ORF Transcript_22305/g.56404 Transcript_22305/m.56404 type:complete len:276 (-) Transcript_22305:252-1079(-)|eukprot:g3402.t1
MGVLVAAAHHHQPVVATSFYIDCTQETGALEVLPSAFREVCSDLLGNFYKKRWRYENYRPFKLIFDHWTDLLALQWKLYFKRNLTVFVEGQDTKFYNTKTGQWSKCVSWRMSQCGKYTARSSWVPQQFQERFCKDDWYECQTMEEPWTYFGWPSLQQWNSACGVGPAVSWPLMSGGALHRLGSCSGPRDVCLVPTYQGDFAHNVQHFWRTAGRMIGMTQEQMFAWTGTKEHECQNIGQNVNKHVLEFMEKEPEKITEYVTPKKLKWLWDDKVVFF